MKKERTYHFIGIGGISMSGIAMILKDSGNTVTGSDAFKTDVTNSLEKHGIKITQKLNKEFIDNADIIVYTAAISLDNEELVYAKSLNKPVIERAPFLGELTKEYKEVICVSGTHGKSTTTGMLSTTFINSKLNPTIQIGAYLDKISGNYYIGNKDYFIMEACEYKNSFLSFFPTTEVILNIDDDHLDFFKNMDGVMESYNKYVKLLNKNSNLIINIDNEFVNKLQIPTNINKYTISLNNYEANLYAKDITINNIGLITFKAIYNNEYLDTYTLKVKGNHNIYNALSCIMVSLIYNIDKNIIKNSLFEYVGVKRRFEFIGTYKKNILVYDDYAHHPTEIKSTLNSVNSIPHNKSWAIFQSHTYSRTYEHLEEFSEILKEFDNIIIAKIYPAREKNIWNVKEDELVNLIKKYNPNVRYIEFFSDIVSYIKENVREEDIVITIGAGPINEVAYKIIED